uniref:Uncharacterized protein n=1 Tax=Rhizophora mucronata TaxID=61149 RepID=A0A2P2Q627_RHIMU
MLNIKSITYINYYKSHNMSKTVQFSVSQVLKSLPPITLAIGT